MLKTSPLLVVCACCLAFFPREASALPSPKNPQAKPASVPAKKTVMVASAVPRQPIAPAELVAVAATAAPTQFAFEDPSGKKASAEVVQQYQSKKIVQPIAKTSSGVGPELRRAASIAQERAHAHSKSRCWRYVKEALMAAGVIDSRPKTIYAKQAASELVHDFGFKKLSVRDPFRAPVGAVLVYGAKGPGHVEIRTKDGFVSDFRSKTPSPRPLIGVYAKS